MSAQTKLDEIAQRFELPGRIVRLFGELHDLSPEMAGRLLDELRTVAGGSNGSVGPRPTRKATRRLTKFDRLARMFVQTGNAPKTKVQMEVAAKLSHNSIHTIVYTSHKGAFKKIDDPQGGRSKLHQLTPEALEAAKGGHHASP